MDAAWKDQGRQWSFKGIYCCMALIFCAVLLLFVPSDDYQRELSQKILRFHVVANSNSYEDQQLKLSVRNALVEYLSPKMENCQSLEESRQVLVSEMENIQGIAQNIVERAGYSYLVKAALGCRHFPEKTYGNMTFPRGYYEALSIHIGSGMGRNWWCVLFPNLCFTDAVSAYVPSDSKALLEEELAANTYEALYAGDRVQIRFKLGEILADLFK